MNSEPTTEKVEPYQPKVLPILKWLEDKRLHEKSTDVVVFDENLEHLVLDMLHTMKTANGVGLAAPQVGVLSNVIAIWIEPEKPLVFVNPVITFASTELFKFNEGCLSVPGYFEDRERPNQIIIKFVDVKGNPHEFECNGLYAFAIQHEIDHLNGKLFVDGVSLLKKSRIKSKMKKVAKRLNK